MAELLPYVIALYIRLSIEDSKTESMSIENQRLTLHRYADAMEDVRNVEVLEFVDNGHTGTNFERPAVREMLDMVREGRINCIIVKDFSRFGRNSIEVGYLMECVFPVYGVRFISVNDDFDSGRLHGDTGGLSVAFRYLAAEFYSRDLSVKSKSAKYVKMKRGEYQSVLCPYGFQKGADGRMEPDAETAETVRLIYELALRGNDCGQIRRELFARGIPTPAEHKALKGGKQYDISRCCGLWDRSTILRILRDERYAGTYIIGRSEVTEVGSSRVRQKDESEWFRIPDHHPAIVSRETYDAVQMRLGERKHIEKTPHTYPLKRKVFCGYCRHALRKEYGYFSCRYTNADKTAPCHGLRISEPELEEMIYTIISKQAQVILNVENLATASQQELCAAERAECEKQIARCRDRKRVLYEQFVLREVSPEDYKVGTCELDKELDRLRRVFDASQADRETKNANQVLAQQIQNTKRLTCELADALSDKVFVYRGQEIEVEWKVKDFLTEA